MGQMAPLRTRHDQIDHWKVAQGNEIRTTKWRILSAAVSGKGSLLGVTHWARRWSPSAVFRSGTWWRVIGWGWWTPVVWWTAHWRHWATIPITATVTVSISWLVTTSLVWRWAVRIAGNRGRSTSTVHVKVLIVSWNRHFLLDYEICNQDILYDCLHHLKEVDHLEGHIGLLDLLDGHKVKACHHQNLHCVQQGHLHDHHLVTVHLCLLLHHHHLLLRLLSFQLRAKTKCNIISLHFRWSTWHQQWKHYLNSDARAHKFRVVQRSDSSFSHFFGFHVHKAKTVKDVTFCYDAILLKQGA